MIHLHMSTSHLAFSSDMTYSCTNNSTSDIWKKKRRIHSIYWYMMQMGECGLTSMVVCSNGKTHDIRERNATIRSEIWTKNIRSLGFWDSRECVTLQRLILRSLGCISDIPIMHDPQWGPPKWTAGGDGSSTYIPRRRSGELSRTLCQISLFVFEFSLDRNTRFGAIARGGIGAVAVLDVLAPIWILSETGKDVKHSRSSCPSCSDTGRTIIREPCVDL